MEKRDWISFGCILGSIAVGSAIGVMLSDIATVKAGWCDARPACMRDWIAALSGWAAAIGALIAALLTLPKLRMQAHEARRQTDFLYGDAPPSMSVLPDLDDPQLLVVRIVNWNRRTIVARQIEVLGLEGGTLQLYDHKKNNEKVNHKKIYVGGWENRAGPPETYQVRLAYEKDGTLLGKWPDDIEVEMTVRILDASHKTIRLYAAFSV